MVQLQLGSTVDTYLDLFTTGPPSRFVIIPGKGQKNHRVTHRTKEEPRAPNRFSNVAVRVSTSGITGTKEKETNIQRWVRCEGRGRGGERSEPGQR